jgi:hypothetical protein
MKVVVCEAPYQVLGEQAHTDQKELEEIVVFASVHRELSRTSVLARS